MDKFNDVYLDFNQTDSNIDDVNLNAVWVDLDKGLLSDNIGQQCEFIVKLTELFDKYPLPVFVNSGFLRLAKIFQNGNNYLKLQVIRVIEKNQKHLQKILNVEEISKLIFYNIHSNDCVCRALTLRALAEISLIISDKHNVQHSIRLALESHDELEAKEAIYAANKFCSVSKSFAASLFDRISEMIEDIQSPLDRKMKLIPLLRHMHHDTILSAKAKNLCILMFYSFPRADISKIILNTITKIASKSLTNIYETITFFIKLLHEEPREKLHLILLKNLYYLAKTVAHLWTNDNINSFIAYTNDQKQNSLILLRASEILCTLSLQSNVYFYFVFNTKENLELVGDDETAQSLIKTNKNLIDNNLLKQLIEDNVFHENKQIAFNFCLFSTTLLVFQSKNIKKKLEINIKEYEVLDSNYLFDLAKNGLFEIILECNQTLIQSKKSNQSNDIKLLKNCLKCTIDLVQMNNQCYLNELYTFITCLISTVECNVSRYYCDALLTLCRFNVDNSNDDETLTHTTTNSSELIIKKQKFISNIFDKLVNDDNRKADPDLQLKLINLLFELQIRRDLNDITFVDKSIEKFLSLNEKNSWQIFKLARMCVRYAYFDLASRLYDRMAITLSSACFNMSSNDLSYKCWLDFMSILCKAECLITQSNVENVNDFIENLNQALAMYQRAQTIFKSCCTRCLQLTSNPIQLENANVCFQIRYCELRSEHIKLYIHMILSTMTYVTIPAPIFQFKSSENFNKLGRIASQMKYITNELQKLSQKYKELISECFDADKHTLNILNICKRQIECLIYCVNLLSSFKSEQALREEFHENFIGKRIFLANEPSQMTDNHLLNENTAEMKIIENFYLNLYEKLKILCKEDKDTPVKFNQIKEFQDIVTDFISMPVPLPRQFFTTLQRTQIKLIINPNTKKSNTIVTIRNDQNLVVKIDGIINQYCKTSQPIRSIKKIQICLTIELDTKNCTDQKFIPNKYSDVKTSIEEPKNDYFNCNLLINFPYIGNYIIQVDLYIVDDLDIVWHYLDCKNQILVKVEDDPVRQKLIAALNASTAAAAAAAAASSTISNSSNVNITNVIASQQQAVTPNGLSVPQMYQTQRTVTPTNLDSKMDI